MNDFGITDTDSYDTIIGKLHATGPTFAYGLSNHAPMALDALVNLGATDRLSKWAAHYSGKLEPLEPADGPTTLGDGNSAAWITRYLQQGLDPSALFAQEFDTLAPGMAASAFHGLLRAAHAIRAIRRKDTPPRRRELAHGLGVWAATWTPLPGVPGSPARPGLDVASALEQIALVPKNQRTEGGLITPRLGVLGAGFAAKVASVDLNVEPAEDALTKLIGVAACLVAAHPGNIALLHALTGPAALRFFWDWLSQEQQQQAVGYAFQVVAGLHATHARVPGIPDVPAATRCIADLRSQAIETDDEHIIKLADTCIREHRLMGDDRPLAALEAWLHR